MVTSTTLIAILLILISCQYVYGKQNINLINTQYKLRYGYIETLGESDSYFYYNPGYSQYVTLYIKFKIPKIKTTDPYHIMLFNKEWEYEIGIKKDTLEVDYAIQIGDNKVWAWYSTDIHLKLNTIHNLYFAWNGTNVIIIVDNITYKKQFSSSDTPITYNSVKKFQNKEYTSKLFFGARDVDLDNKIDNFGEIRYYSIKFFNRFVEYNKINFTKPTFEITPYKINNKELLRIGIKSGDKIKCLQSFALTQLL